MRTVPLFCFFVFFVLGFNLYANPVANYTESMGWINKSERDAISVGGIKTREAGSLMVYEFHNANGKFTLALSNNMVVGVFFENEKAISYKNEDEFNNDVERIGILAGSMGGYIHHDRSAKDINHVHYRIDSFENTYVINMDIFSFLTNKPENNYGHYSVMITPLNDHSVFGIFRPLPPGPPPPGAR